MRFRLVVARRRKTLFRSSSRNVAIANGMPQTSPSCNASDRTRACSPISLTENIRLRTNSKPNASAPCRTGERSNCSLDLVSDCYFVGVAATGLGSLNRSSLRTDKKSALFMVIRESLRPCLEWTSAGTCKPANSEYRM